MTLKIISITVLDFLPFLNFLHVEREILSHVCVSVCLYNCSCVGVVPVCVNRGQKIISTSSSRAWFIEEGLSLAWSSPIKLEWLGSKPQGPSSLCPPSVGMISHTPHHLTFSHQPQVLMPSPQSLKAGTL